ncbi:MAG: carotenoid oxygenase family protein [Aquabacterium sp.]
MPSPIETAIRNKVTQGLMKLADFNRQRMADKPNPFLAGLNAPMDKEVTLHDLSVTGTIPPQLDGRYLRIGPNPIGTPKGAAHHWFVGDGMVHGVRLQAGRALWYRNRWVRSNAVSQALGEPPAPGPRRRSDTVNTNVLGLGGRTWALVEAGGNPVELGEDLQTLAHNPFDGSLTGSFTAHPHQDPLTGDWHAICYDGPVQDRIRHVVIGADGRVRREEPIAVQHGPSVHDCMITRQYVIVLDLPVTFSMPLLMAGYTFPYKWNPQHRARVGLLRKDAPGDSIVWCDVAPCYVFHPCNAFENDDGTVTLDVVAHETMFDGDTMGPSAKAVGFERWTIDPAARRVERRVVDAALQEFPRPDERRLGQPYRYAYSVGLVRDDGPDGSFVASQYLYRHDLHTGQRLAHDLGPRRHASEFVFVPRQADADEDDGWLMGYVVDAATDTTDLVILDARDFSGAPVARITIPHRIPSGFHGNWVPAR